MIDAPVGPGNAVAVSDLKDQILEANLLQQASGKGGKSWV